MSGGRFSAGMVAAVTVMAFVCAAVAMARAGYWFSPLAFAIVLPLVVRSVWRDRA